MKGFWNNPMEDNAKACLNLTEAGFYPANNKCTLLSLVQLLQFFDELLKLAENFVFLLFSLVLVNAMAAF